MQFTNKMFTISYHKFYKREFWESFMEHSTFNKVVSFGIYVKNFFQPSTQ